MNLTPVPDCSFQVVNAGLTEEAVHVLCVYACKAVSVHACIRLSASVLWFETAVSSAARCRCWQPPSLHHEENSCFTSMSGCEPCPCGSVVSSTSSPPSELSRTHTLTLAPHICLTFKCSNVSLCLPSLLIPSAFTQRWEKIELHRSWFLPKPPTAGLLTSKQIEGYFSA